MGYSREVLHIFFFIYCFFFNKLDKHIYKKEFLFIGLLWGKFEIDFLGGV